MNSGFLLTRKRARNSIKTRNGITTNKHLNSKMVQFNGFNIIELHHTESLLNYDAPKNDQIQDKINLESKEQEPNIHEIIENNPEIKELKRTKAKNIEEYYTSKFGSSTIKENCFKCLMTDFLSNELLYFNSRKDLFNYIKYCFVFKNKLIITDEDIFKENKEKFFNANTSFINGWRFFIPKTICKGCFMEIINMKNLIANIKTIFCDIEKDSLCKTNYRNYALFSSRFRAAFSLRCRTRHPKRNRNSIRNKRSRIIRRKIRNIDLENIECIVDNEQKEKIYNSSVEYITDNNIIIINKNILEDSVLDQLKNKSFDKIDKSQNNNLCKNINDNKLIIINNKNNLNEKNIKILFDLKNQNNININVNNKNTINLNKIKECFNNTNDIFLKLISFLDNLRKKIIIICFSLQNRNNFFPYQINQFIACCQAFFYSYDEEKKIFTVSEKALIDLNGIIEDIKNMEINEKDIKNFTKNIQDLKNIIDENKNNIEFLDKVFTSYFDKYKNQLKTIIASYNSFLQK